jgi:hypothetical protein
MAAEDEAIASFVIIHAAEGLVWMQGRDVDAVMALAQGGVSLAGRVQQSIHKDKTVENTSDTRARVRTQLKDADRVMLLLAHERGDRSRVVRDQISARGFVLVEKRTDGTNAPYIYGPDRS